MANIVVRKDSIDSSYDFELKIDRTHRVDFSYSYPDSKKLKGIVFIIAGFGADINSEYTQKLRNYIAEKFSAVAVSVVYHCFYSRVDNGASLVMDETDIKLLEKYKKKYNIKDSKDDSMDAILNKIDTVNQNKKDMKVILSMDIIPKNSEYQNFGVLQALDHLNVLKSIERKSLNFDENYSVTMMGSSHGGYIAYLTAKIAPHKIDTVIDNSSYVLPPYKYIVGKEHNFLKAEYTLFYSKNITINCFTKSGWTLNKGATNYFSSDRYKIRNIMDYGHLNKMNSYETNRTRYVSYHSSNDLIAPVSDKIELYRRLNDIGFEAELHLIEDVDGKFIKTLDHGMDISMKELANKELPKALDVSHKHQGKENSPISYKCDTLEYTFKIEDEIYTGKDLPIEKELEEASIEALAIERYTKNIEYLEKNQSGLFKKLLAFDSAMEKGHYQAKYDLIMKDDYFDVLELSSGNYLYSSSSDEYASIASDSIDFRKNSNTFETFKKVDVREEDLVKYAQVDITDNNLSGFAPILSYIDNNKPNVSTLDKIKKFIFFGVGLGTHLITIDKKISANVYFIIEDDLELFKLSLFTTPYYELALRAKLIFSVFAQENEFSRDAIGFLNTEFENNHYLKYFHMLSHSESKVQEFHAKVTSQTHNLFYYSDILQQYIRPLDYLKNNFNFLNLVKLHANSYFNSKPVLLIAAGPSLSKNIQWLRENHKKFILVALSATLSILEENSIVPDIVTHIDGLSVASVHFNKLNSLDFLKNTLFLLSAKSHREIVDKLNKEHLFFFENGTSYKKDFGNLTAPCVGSTTYLLMLIFNVQELYLLGLDLALDSKTLSTHAHGHAFAKKLELSSMDEDTLSYKRSIIKTLGNFSEEVPTTLEYKFSIDSINTSSQSLKSDTQKIYNLSDGAKFLNTIATLPDNIKLKDIDKNLLKNELYTIFSSNSSAHITEDELQSLDAKTSHSLNIKDIILTQKNSTFSSVDEFLNSLTTLVEKLSISSSLIDYDLALVYDNYFKFINTFVFDFFNTKELENKEQFIPKLNKELTRQLLRIEITYEKALNGESIEKLALQTYEKNLDFFSHHHPELSTKLQAFENLSRAPKYDLEYLDGYFDVKELKSAQYLYGGDTKAISKEFTQLVNFSKNSNTFESFPLYNFSDETLANLDDKSRCLDGIYPIMNHYIANSNMDDTMKSINKFIFIGTGLGLHIPSISEKIGVKECLIIEDDIELFKLSLFTTEYFKLSPDSRIYFSIAEDENLFLKTMNLFLENSFIDNRYLKYSYFPAHSKNKIKQIQNALATQSFMTFPYKTELEKFLRPLEYINDGYSVINFTKCFENSIFKDKPVLLITAGPSLIKNISWLKKNHKKFIIVAVSATLKTLHKNSITPDVVTHLDGFSISMVHFDGFDAKSFLKDTTVILGPFSPSILREMFTKDKIFYYEENTNYFNDFGSIVAPCIGSFSLLLALKLNTQELYLLGLDLAIDQKSGDTHSGLHTYTKTKDMHKKDELSSVMSLRDNLFPVEGNFENTVYTTSVYHQSIHSLFISIPESKSETQSIYNLSDGAKINTAIPKQIDSLRINTYKDIEKKYLAVQISKTLNQNSSKLLTKVDINSLQARVQNAKKIKYYLLDYNRDITYTTSTIYLSKLLELVSKILVGKDRDSNNLTYIYYQFFRYSLPIIVDFLNTEKLKNEAKYIEEFDILLQREILVIESTYEDTLSLFLAKRC